MSKGNTFDVVSKYITSGRHQNLYTKILSSCLSINISYSFMFNSAKIFGTMNKLQWYEDTS